jgi:hypothetical protein
MGASAADRLDARAHKPGDGRQPSRGWVRGGAGRKLYAGSVDRGEGGEDGDGAVGGLEVRQTVLVDGELLLRHLHVPAPPRAAVVAV